MCMQWQSSTYLSVSTQSGLTKCKGTHMLTQSYLSTGDTQQDNSISHSFKRNLKGGQFPEDHSIRVDITLLGGRLLPQYLVTRRALITAAVLQYRCLPQVLSRQTSLLAFA